jgi:hypothetical protein
VSIFDFVAVALSLILGLGVTRLLESGIDLFRSRKARRLHWLPVLWALAVLVQQLQFWWAMYELQHMAYIDVAIFGLLVLLAMLLFVAGALILPGANPESPEDLLDYFTVDGAWGVAAVGAYHLVAILANLFLYGIGWSEPIVWIGLACGVLAFVIAFTGSRSLQAVLSVVWFGLLVLGLIVATLPTYTADSAVQVSHRSSMPTSEDSYVHAESDQDRTGCCGLSLGCA